MLDPSQFADSLILATLKSASTGTIRVHLSNLLATLLGTNRQSTPDEFALRLHLKQTILRAAVHLMHENLQSALQVKSGLLILLALTAACNVFECNRVLVSTMFFKHSTEFLLKETSYLSDLSEIFSKRLFADDSEVFCLCVLSAYQTCEYLKRRRVYGQKEKVKEEPAINAINEPIEPVELVEPVQDAEAIEAIEEEDEDHNGEEPYVPIIEDEEMPLAEDEEEENLEDMDDDMILDRLENELLAFQNPAAH
jgi:hypothetical protein